MSITCLNPAVDKKTDLHSKSGTYVVLLFNDSKKKIQIGRLGKFNFNRGYYIYIGSAMGIGGIKSRVTRHLKKEKLKQWHLDYLRNSIDIVEIWYYYGSEKKECEWASVFNRLDDYKYPVKGFGSSDCKCYSHLVYSKKRPFLIKLKKYIK